MSVHELLRSVEYVVDAEGSIKVVMDAVTWQEVATLLEQLDDQPTSALGHNGYSLRGTPIIYLEPTEPVAQSEWEVLQ